jgi:phosphatidylglycerol---prolipoprotein diacylglyceryl transferase
MPLLAITFPEIDPVAISIGPFAIRWYALAYICGIVLGWIYARALIRKEKLWEGGMSFHGGFLGCVAAVMLFAVKNNISILSLGDITTAVAPIGIFLGRLANFIKGELWGREADASVPWRMVFPEDPLQLFRHPSQLYEAALEGLLLFAVLAVMIRMGALKRPGLILGSFIAIYGLARIASELFREPDPQLGFLWGGLTMGMLLSVPMIIAGAILIVVAWRRETPQHIEKSI